MKKDLKSTLVAILAVLHPANSPEGHLPGFSVRFSIALQHIIGLSLALSIGLLLNILACALWKKWWPIFSVIAYIMAPIPNMLCSRIGTGYDESKQRAFEDVGNFMTAIFVVSGLAVPAILAHIRVIQVGAFLMCISGGVVVYGTILLYLHAFHRAKEEVSYEVY